jgi:hypothetical protein
MELVELQSRAAFDKGASNANEDELNEVRNATGVKKKGNQLSVAQFHNQSHNMCSSIATAVGSKTYILRSVLHPVIVEHAALTDEQILEEEGVDAASDDEDDEGTPVRSYGSILSWSTADQLGPTAVLYTILALILVNGRVMSDSKHSFSSLRLKY